MKVRISFRRATVDELRDAGLGFAYRGSSATRGRHDSMRLPYRRKRPASLVAWARPFGLTALALAPIAILQNQPAALLGVVTVALALIAYWALRSADPDYMSSFPYEYVADLPQRPHDGSPALERSVRAVLLAGPLLLAMNVDGFGSDRFLTSLPVVGFFATWGFEIPAAPPPWALSLSAAVGLVCAFTMAGIAAIASFGSGPPPIGQALLLGGAGGAALCYLVLALGKAAHRSPGSLLLD